MVPSKCFAPAGQIHKALIQKSTKGLTAEQYVRGMRKVYQNNTSTTTIAIQKRFLENLQKQSLTCILSPTLVNGLPSKSLFRYGFWSIQLVCDSINDSGFTIGTLVSNNQGMMKYRYHPDAIENQIVTAFGGETYQIWKKQILGNLDDLRYLIEVVKDFMRLSGVQPLTSVSCCKRSEVLCRRVGLPVVDGIVILEA